jgi:F-type H+/Na+-transporting ATPase subunit alpha
MAVSLFAVDRGYLDDVALDKVGDFEAALHAYMASAQKALIDKINVAGDYDDAIEAALAQALDAFKSSQSW